MVSCKDMASLTSAFLRPRFALLKPLQVAPPSYHQTMMIKNYYSNDCSSGIMGEKARSTAEEFKRQAKEKADSVSEGAKEAGEGSKESTVSTSNSSEKDKLKETVEKGNYDKIGKE